MCSKNSAVIFFGIALQWSVCYALDCPPSFRNILGVCLNFTETTLPWCHAQKYCSSLDGELVRGNSFLPLNGETFSGMPKFYWIGMTDLLYERRINQSGWRWSNGDLEPASTELKWSRGEPNTPSQDFVTQCHGSGQLCDAPHNYKSAPMCQPRSQPNANVRRKDFLQDSITVGSPPDDFAQFECSTLLTNVRSRIECAKLCTNEAHNSCESFYFNKERKECRVVVFADATVDMGDAKGWKRFSYHSRRSRI